jgi:hypothetical protein
LQLAVEDFFRRPERYRTPSALELIVENEGGDGKVAERHGRAIKFAVKIQNP